MVSPKKPCRKVLALHHIRKAIPPPTKIRPDKTKYDRKSIRKED